MLLAITFVIFLAILIVTHEFGHFIMAKLFKLRVDEFAFGFPPKIWSKKKGDTTYSINALPFGGYVKIYGESEEAKDPNEKPERAFYAQPAWKRAIIIGAGVAMNFLVGWLALSTFLFFSPKGVFIESVVPGSPAESAGFKSGDRLEGFTSSTDFINYVNQNAGKEIIVDGKAVTPRTNPNPGEGRLGVKLIDSGATQYNFFGSLHDGFIGSILTIGMILSALGGLVTGVFQGNGGQVLNNLSGPIGIVGELGKSLNNGFLFVIEFLAVLSLNLAVFNLLPVPALDGGRLLFILIEKIIRRKLNAQAENIANMIGFACMILLALVITGHDIWKIFVKS